MSYFTHDDLAALIPPAFLLQALDDDADGVEDAFDTVQTNACGAVDAYLSARFAVPLTENIPQLVKEAAKTFAAELCYQRRGVADEQNPWHKKAERLRSMLAAVAKGDVPLQVSPASPAPVQPAGSIVDYDSRLGEPGRILG